MTQTNKVVGITGGTGTVGKRLIPLLLHAGYSVIVLSRNPGSQKQQGGVRYALWNPENNTCDNDALSAIDYMIHLAGEPVAGKRWTAEQKKLIADSRILGTRFLVSELRKAGRCSVFVGASAIGFYGADMPGNAPFTEDAPASAGFLSETCAAWEAEELKATEFARTVTLRIGIVLARDGGALPEFTRTAGMRILGIPGSGSQYVSWIHVDDLAGMILHAIQSASLQGVYNAVAPTPVTCRQLMNGIAKEKGGFFLTMPVPAVFIKIALGEMSIEILKSTNVSAQKIVGTGFQFRYPELGSALHDLLS